MMKKSGGERIAMSDRPIQLDASFDARAHYTILVWLRPRDAMVQSGEPVAVVIDGAVQRVIPAPCSGRIVSVYADEGARVLPRTIIGMIRPTLVLPDIVAGSRSGVIAGAVIVLTMAFVAFANATPNTALIQLPTVRLPEQSSAEPTPQGDATLIDATAYPEPNGTAVATELPVDEPLEAPTEPPVATTDGSLPTATAELPLVATPESDPFDPGVDIAAEQQNIINLARQAATIALGSAQFFKPGLVDDAIWTSTLEFNMIDIRSNYDQINAIYKKVKEITVNQEIIDELDRYRAGIGTCLEPYQLAEAARAGGSEITAFETQFVQCQQFLDGLPQQS
jgi:hypothetical protein